MKRLACPHCGNRHMVRVGAARDVILVAPCPACHELVVLFRSKAIGLSRKILAEGTISEQKAHLAEVIAKFIEPGLFAQHFGDPPHPNQSSAPEVRGEIRSGNESPPIQQSEVDKFVEIDLECLDDPAYFKRHFG